MTGVVLAGGMSSRMGFNKAFIRLEDGRTLIERGLDVLKGVFDDVFIVANDVLLYEGLDARVASDVYKGAGSLGGIYTALFHSRSDYTFVAACDMPCLDPASIRRLVRLSPGFDAVVPFAGGRLHPLHAVYSRRCLKPINEMIATGDLKIGALLDRVRTRRAEAGEFEGADIVASVENINTREDLARLGLSFDACYHEGLGGSGKGR
jgi:molybdopterin-guanine dinucleotide biosynthesis protein A